MSGNTITRACLVLKMHILGDHRLQHRNSSITRTTVNHHLLYSKRDTYDDVSKEYVGTKEK